MKPGSSNNIRNGWTVNKELAEILRGSCEEVLGDWGYRRHITTVFQCVVPQFHPCSFKSTTFVENVLKVFSSGRARRGEQAASRWMGFPMSAERFCPVSTREHSCLNCCHCNLCWWRTCRCPYGMWGGQGHKRWFEKEQWFQWSCHTAQFCLPEINHILLDQPLEMEFRKWGLRDLKGCTLNRVLQSDETKI